MTKLEFNSNDRPTLGVELELGLVDAQTMALASSYGLLAARLTADGQLSDESSHFKPELMQCVMEINTDVCETIPDAEADLRAKLAALESAADAIGLRLWWGGSHPFSLWKDQRVTPDERYLMLLGILQEMG